MDLPRLPSQARSTPAYIGQRRGIVGGRHDLATRFIFTGTPALREGQNTQPELGMRLAS
jgi:hypothetical protein